MRAVSQAWSVAATVVVGLAVCVPAAASDADCAKARDAHGDFKAIWSDSAPGKPHEELVRHRQDGTVEVSGTLGTFQFTRESIRGLFTKVEKRNMNGRKVELAFSHTIDVSKLLPLQGGASATYRTITVMSERAEPQFADVTFGVGKPHEIVIGACKLTAFDVTFQTEATKPKPFKSVTRLTYVPDLAYWVAAHIDIAYDGRKRDPIDKTVSAIEALTN